MLTQLLISNTTVSKVQKISEILESNNLKRAHPDVLYFEAGEKLGIAQARQIIDFLSIKPHQAKGRAVILEDASNLTSDAQNALLKTLEEPPKEAITVLGVNSENDLLPTILSRCEIVRLDNSTISANEKEQLEDNFQIIEKLINSPITDRFAYVEKLKEKGEFLKALIIFWRQALLKNPTKENKEFVEELLNAEKWANSNVNLRAILEYLMILMPNH